MIALRKDELIQILIVRDFVMGNNEKLAGSANVLCPRVPEWSQGEDAKKQDIDRPPTRLEIHRTRQFAEKTGIEVPSHIECSWKMLQEFRILVAELRWLQGIVPDKTETLVLDGGEGCQKEISMMVEYVISKLKNQNYSHQEYCEELPVHLAEIYEACLPAARSQKMFASLQTVSVPDEVLRFYSTTEKWLNLMKKAR